MDFALTLALTAHQEDVLRRRRINYVNHSAHSSLLRKPIVVNVEAKRSGEGDSKVQFQLNVWISAQFRRLEDLFGKALVQELHFLPLLKIQGAQWQFLAAVRTADSKTVRGHHSTISTLTLDRSCGATSTLATWQIYWESSRSFLQFRHSSNGQTPPSKPGFRVASATWTQETRTVCTSWKTKRLKAVCSWSRVMRWGVFRRGA